MNKIVYNYYQKHTMRNSNIEDELVMYILVNNDLQMSKGKIASQVAHAIETATISLLRHSTPIYRDWLKTTSRTKIVLKSTQSEMRDIIQHTGIEFSSSIFSIFDAGKTEIAPNSLTCLIFAPLLRSQTPKYLRKMSLL